MASKTEEAPGEEVTSPGAVSGGRSGPSPSAADPVQSEAPQRIGKIAGLLDISAIAACAARIERETGLTARSSTMRKVQFFSNGDYPKPLGWIRFDDEGEPEASGPDYAPSDDEAKRIKAEWQGISWPEYKPRLFTGKNLPRNNDLIPWSKADPDNIAVCRDRTGEYILCVEERRQLPDGGKIVVIWSPFDEIDWLMAEPPGGLPLFGQEQIADATTLIIHEGPKAAKAMQRMIDDDGHRCPRGGWQNHPWGSELRTAGKVAHIAWLGGAERPGDTDWRPVAESDAKIILVLDNDQPGKDAARPISRAIGRSMRALFFTDQWPARFDLADEFPTEMFEERNGRRIYVGPRFEDCLKSATWATDRVVGEDGGRPAAVLRREFASEWIRSNSPQLYFHRDRPNVGLDADEFNRAARAFSDVDNTARLLDQRPSVGVDGVTYQPGIPGPVLIDKQTGKRVVQRWQDAPIKPVAGSAMPFLRYLTHLVPVKEDRFHLAWWIAVHCARPDVRLKWAPILRSRSQGTGKTTILKILSDQTGRDNVSMPSEQAMAESRYNGFIAYKRLVGCNEFYSNQSFRTYNKIKTWITDAEVEVEMKFIESHTIPATAHFVLCSNEMVPILMDSRDRRFFVPTITENTLPASYWTKLYRWLDSDGPGIIRRWAEEFVAKHWDKCSAERAPMSGAKQAMIDKSIGDEMRLVRDMGEMIADMAERVILPLDEFRDWLTDQKGFQGKKRLGGTTIQEGLRDAGLILRTKSNEVSGKDERIHIDGRKKAVIVNFSPEQGEKWRALAEAHKKTMEELIPITGSRGDR